MSQGWIKLHRGIAKWEWYSSAKHLIIFLDLLLSANHKERNYRGILIKAGQLTTSYQAIATRTGFTIAQVRRVLNDLISTGEIAHEKKKNCSMISIANWSNYQVESEENTHDSLTNDTRLAHDSLTNDTRLATNKNVKNVNNEKNDKNVKNIIKAISQNEIDAQKILDFWNTKEIKKTLRGKTKDKAMKKIIAAFKDFSPKEICTAINNYEKTIRSKETYYTHEWTIGEFIDRGIEKFAQENFNYNQYVKITKSNSAQAKQDRMIDIRNKFAQESLEVTSEHGRY